MKITVRKLKRLVREAVGDSEELDPRVSALRAFDAEIDALVKRIDDGMAAFDLSDELQEMVAEATGTLEEGGYLLSRVQDAIVEGGAVDDEGEDLYDDDDLY